MIKDRAQKAHALRLCVSKGWLPQLEVEVEPTTRIDRSRNLLTDIDVLAVSNSALAQHERFLFDCKSGAKESGIGRAFWLRGVMTRVGAKYGFVVLPEKARILHDHRISAADMSISILHDSELTSFGASIGGDVNENGSLTGTLEAWEAYLSISQKYPQFAEYASFARSGFWMLKDAGERCRRIVSRLRAIRAELDPSKREHLAMFGDAVCLFLIAVSELAAKALLVLLSPASKEEFSLTVLAILYGGQDNVDAAHKLRRIASATPEGEEISIFPELSRFEQLVRELMQAPLDGLPAALLVREVAFSDLQTGQPSNDFQASIVRSARYSPKFLLLAAEYLQRAARLPPEFSTKYSEAALRLLSASARV
jgi:hypothetical protein